VGAGSSARMGATCPRVTGMVMWDVRERQVLVAGERSHGEVKLWHVVDLNCR